jgi:hypothetical protein
MWLSYDAKAEVSINKIRTDTDSLFFLIPHDDLA